MHQKSDQDSHIVNEIISESIEVEIERSPVDLWDEIGFHKPMAGFWYNILYTIIGFYIASIPSLFLMTLVLFIVFFPLTGILGGWDDDNLAEFKKVAKMSGPSKFVVVPIYNILKKVTSKSKLHNCFQMPVAEVKREAQELLAIKLENRDKFKESN